MSECSSSIKSVSSDTLVLKNAQPWQQQSKSDMTVNGYFRAGAKNAKRIHLLHGTGFSAMTLAAMASQLPSDWSIWLTDVPGHGGSTRPTAKMPDWPKMANTVADAIYRQANVKEDGPLIGIGHSMGGVLTLFASRKYPDLFSEIILLDPVLFPTEMLIAQQVMAATGTWRQRALVKSVANRTSTWPNLAEMKNSIASKSFYKAWHSQVISDYCQFSTELNSDESVQLSCQPSWESAIFGSYPKRLWHTIRSIDVPVDILIANKSYFFIPKAVTKATKINKYIQSQIFGQHHCFPMEEPIETAQAITRIIATKN